jgi:nucleoid-associated protein YgaU
VFDLVTAPFTAASQTATNIGTGAGLYAGLATGIAQFRTLKSAGGLTVSVSGNEIVVGGYSFSAGSIPFAGSDGLLSVTSSVFRYDAANIRLGVGGAPVERIHIVDNTNGQVALRIEQTTSGTAARATMRIYSGSSVSVNFIIQGFSPGWTTTGVFDLPGRCYLQAAEASMVIMASNAAGDVIVVAGGAAAANERAHFYANGNVQLGSNSITVSSSVGFVHIPSVAGAPVAAPVALTGYVPMVYDRTNHRIYFYSGAWRSVAVA